MDGLNVTFTIGFLRKTIVADFAFVFRRCTALVFQVTFQTALVLVTLVALVANERFGGITPI